MQRVRILIFRWGSIQNVRKGGWGRGAARQARDFFAVVGPLYAITYLRQKALSQMGPPVAGSEQQRRHFPPRA